ncbi:MAG: TIM barrel protein [Chloroflexi bacterium]|nr:TIM barrel protein [Chloroflexota bacterium]
MTALVLLKARPTELQLADRLRDPVPAGLELYLDTVDLATQDAMDGVVERLNARGLPSNFVLLVEGPIRSLDGEFFDLSRDSEADRELSRRIVDLSRRIGARGANVHAIAPDADTHALTLENRARLLEQATEPARFFADLAIEAGIVPTIENMPPILRMRESGFFYSAIGMPPQDMTALTSAVPGLKIVLDTSHAQLYLNVRRGVREDVAGQNLGPLYGFVAEAPGVDTIAAYVDALGDDLVACHIANAAGLLGEGMPYGEGDLDLDSLVPLLARRARYLVTETLEPDNNRADLMRDARERAERALGAGR